MAKFCIAVLLISLHLSCSRATEYQSSQDAVIKSEVEIMFKNYHMSIAEKGLTAEFDFLDNSDDFFWVPPGYQSALSYDSVHTILTQNALVFKQVNFEWDTLRINPLHKNLASFTGIVSGTMETHSGEITSMKIIESGTVIKRKDGWKLLNGQSALLDETNQ